MTQSITLYKYKAELEYAASRPPIFVVLSTHRNPTKYSKIHAYFQDKNLGFKIEKENTALLIYNLSCRDYTSSLSKPSEKDLKSKMTKEDGPDSEKWKCGYSLSLPLIHSPRGGLETTDGPQTFQPRGLKLADSVTYMEILTGWRLLFSEASLGVAVKRRLSPAWTNRGRGQVMLWASEVTRGLQLLIRFEPKHDNTETEDTSWLSATCKLFCFLPPVFALALYLLFYSTNHIYLNSEHASDDSEKFSDPKRPQILRRTWNIDSRHGRLS